MQSTVIIACMTIWTPNLTGRGGPLYQAIAAAIAEDVDSGKLLPGEPLPTQRELASRLGVALTTVTRGYGEAERRGLVSGEVGRGTFVQRGLAVPGLPDSELGEPDLVDLTVNSIFPRTHARRVAEVVSAVALGPGGERNLNYVPSAGEERHRRAGAEWISRTGLEARADRVVVTCGAQHAMSVTLGTICDPGDLVLTAEFTYSGMKSLANHYHFGLKGVAADDQGLRPDAFEKACRADDVTALYCMPSIQNPTATVMSAERRKEIASIAQRFDVLIVEDDSYGYLVDETPLSAYAPTRSFYITSAAKAIVPGLRVGYIVAPPEAIGRLAGAICTTVWMASPLLAEVMTRCIADGLADEIVNWKREEITERQRMATELLSGLQYSTHPQSQHLWLNLPSPWRADDFTAQARLRGVAVTPHGEFVIGRAPEKHAVRLCLGWPSQRSTLERGLAIIVETLSAAPEPVTSVV